MAIAEAAKAISDNANKMTSDEAEKATTDAEFNEVCPRRHYGSCPHRKCGPFKCTFCRLEFETRDNFVEHQAEARTKTIKCDFCGNRLHCNALKKHMKNIHGKDFRWLVKAYN